MTLLSELKRIDQMHDSGEISQEEHDRLSAQAVKKYQPKIDARIKKIAVAALIIALIGWAIPASTITSTNQTLGFNIIVDNTNLAPTGPDVGDLIGTGQRVQGTVYWNNNSDIELFVWGHAKNISQTAELHLFINGTKVADTSGRALGAAEQSNKTIVAIIPKYSSYKIEAHNAHHYEWREYQILPSNTSSCTACVNQTQLNEKVNKSGDTWTGNMIMDGTTIITNTVGDKDTYIYQESAIPTIRLKARNVSSSGYFELFPTSSDFAFSGRTYTFNQSAFDMNNATIINCANCANETQLNGKVNRTGDELTGALYNNGSNYNQINLSDNLNQIIISSQNVTTGNLGEIGIYPEQISLNVGDGVNNEMLFADTGLKIIGNGINSSGGLDMNGNNIIEVSQIAFIPDDQTLLNETGAATSSTNEGGYLTWAQFTPSSNATTNLLSLNIASFSSGANMRMAIYDDNGSIAPGNLLSQSISISVISTGFNNISIPEISLTSGTRYWLAFQTQNTVTTYYTGAATNVGKFRAFTYGSFPTTAGTTANSSAFHMRIYSHVGELTTRYCLRIGASGELLTTLC